MSKHKNLGLLALAVLAYLLSGCAVSYRANSRFQEQAPQIRTVAILPLEVKVYQIDAAGSAKKSRSGLPKREITSSLPWRTSYTRRWRLW